MSIIQSLIEKYQQEPEEKIVEATLSGGEVLRFRGIRDYDELCDLKQRAAEFYKRIRSNKMNHPDMAPYLPRSGEAAATVFLLSELSVEPKLEQLDVMKMCKLWKPEEVASLAAQIDASLTTEVSRSDEEAFAEAKNE